MEIKLKLPMILVLLTVLVSCGGGGGGGSDDQGINENENPPPDQSDSGARNPGLTGRVLFTDNSGLYAIDAVSGEYSYIPNTNWREQYDRFRYPAVTSFGSSMVPHSGSVFVANGDEVAGSYVFAQDFSGNVLWQFELEGEVLGTSISQDMQYIALFRRLGSVSSTPWFELFTPSGQLLEDRQYDGRQLFFLRDNRLFYSSGRTFVFTKPASLEEDYYLTLPDPAEGTVPEGLIGDKTISPDESQIAFAVTEFAGNDVYGARNSRIFVMNMDGSGLRLLATTYNDDKPSVIQPAWSPDGRWILVKEGYRPTGNVDDIESHGYRYVIPADDPGKVYYISPNDAERSPEVKFFRHRDEKTGIITARAGPLPFTSWIPD